MAEVAERAPESTRTTVTALVARAEMPEIHAARAEKIAARRREVFSAQLTAHRADLDLLLKRNADTATYPQLARLEASARDIGPGDLDDAGRDALEKLRKELKGERARFESALGSKLASLDEWFGLEVERAARGWAMQEHTVAKGGDPLEVSENEVKNLREEKRRAHDKIVAAHGELEDEAYRFSLDTLQEALARHPMHVKEAGDAFVPIVDALSAPPHEISPGKRADLLEKGKSAFATMAEVKKERDALGKQPTATSDRAPALRRWASISFVGAALVVLAAVIVATRSGMNATIAAAAAVGVIVGVLVATRLRGAADKADREAAERHDRWTRAQLALDEKQIDAARDALVHHLVFHALEAIARQTVKESEKVIAAMDAFLSFRGDRVKQDRLEKLRAANASFKKIYADAALRVVKERPPG